MHGAAATITDPPKLNEQVVATVDGSNVNVHAGLAPFDGDDGAVITGAVGAVVSYV